MGNPIAETSMYQQICSPDYHIAYETKNSAYRINIDSIRVENEEDENIIITRGYYEMTVVDISNNEIEKFQAVFIYNVNLSNKTCDIIIEKTPITD